jgi:hypothetical protein
LRKLFGVGKPRALQGEGGFAALMQLLSSATSLRHWLSALTPVDPASLLGSVVAA